jgi:hypothetical protein
VIRRPKNNFWIKRRKIWLNIFFVCRSHFKTQVFNVAELFAGFSLGELSPFNVAECLRKVWVEYLIVALLKPFQDQQRLLRSRGRHQLHPPGQAYERVRKNPGTRVVKS